MSPNPGKAPFAPQSMQGAPAPATPSALRAQAISVLFRDHNRALVNFLKTRLPDEQDAREVAQEAYVKLLQLDQPVAVGVLRWYLFKIARCIAIDRQRQRSARTRLDSLEGPDDLDLSSSTEDKVMASDELSRLLSALKELPAKCQHAFLLHRLQGLTTLEVAKRMRLTDRMVRLYVKRALVYCRFRAEGLSPAEAQEKAGS